MLPKSWDDVFYLTRKEIQQDPSIPNFTLKQIESIHKLYWSQVKEVMRDESQSVTIHKLLRFVPKPDANGNHEKRKELLAQRSAWRRSREDAQREKDSAE